MCFACKGVKLKNVLVFFVLRLGTICRQTGFYLTIYIPKFQYVSCVILCRGRLQIFPKKLQSLRQIMLFHLPPVSHIFDVCFVVCSSI